MFDNVYLASEISKKGNVGKKLIPIDVPDSGY